MNQPSVVVVGSGLAGYTVVRELRKLDAAVPITLLSADHGSFIQNRCYPMHWQRVKRLIRF